MQIISQLVLQSPIAQIGSQITRLQFHYILPATHFTNMI